MACKDNLHTFLTKNNIERVGFKISFCDAYKYMLPNERAELWEGTKSVYSEGGGSRKEADKKNNL